MGCESHSLLYSSLFSLNIEFSFSTLAYIEFHGLKLKKSYFYIL